MDEQNSLLAVAEARFRDAVRREQGALMASGIGRAEATEVLLGRLRGDGYNNCPPSVIAYSTFPSLPCNSRNRARANASASPSGFSTAEIAALVNVHGYTPDDAAQALTICHEIRRLEAEGIGGVAATEELTKRVVFGGGGAAQGGFPAGGCRDGPGVEFGVTVSSLQLTALPGSTVGHGADLEEVKPPSSGTLPGQYQQYHQHQQQHHQHAANAFGRNHPNPTEDHHGQLTNGIALCNVAHGQSQGHSYGYVTPSPSPPPSPRQEQRPPQRLEHDGSGNKGLEFAEWGGVATAEWAGTGGGFGAPGRIRHSPMRAPPPAVVCLDPERGAETTVAVATTASSLSPPRLGGKKRQHTTISQHRPHHRNNVNHGGVVDTGMPPSPFHLRAVTATATGMNATSAAAPFPVSGFPAIAAGSVGGGAGEGTGINVSASKGEGQQAETHLVNTPSIAMMAPSSSEAAEPVPFCGAGLSLSAAVVAGGGFQQATEGTGGACCDGMDLSGSSFGQPSSSSVSLAKRQRCHALGGGGAGADGARKDSPQVALVEQEQQERQLQLAFHQMGVRQRNTSPGTPLMSVLPPKRARTPDDHSHGKRPRND